MNKIKRLIRGAIYEIASTIADLAEQVSDLVAETGNEPNRYKQRS